MDSLQPRKAESILSIDEQIESFGCFFSRIFFSLEMKREGIETTQVVLMGLFCIVFKRKTV